MLKLNLSLTVSKFILFFSSILIDPGYILYFYIVRLIGIFNHLRYLPGYKIKKYNHYEYNSEVVLKRVNL
jgi:hypothetical protein